MEVFPSCPGVETNSLVISSWEYPPLTHFTMGWRESRAAFLWICVMMAEAYLADPHSHYILSSERNSRPCPPLPDSCCPQPLLPIHMLIGGGLLSFAVRLVLHPAAPWKLGKSPHIPSGTGWGLSQRRATHPGADPGPSRKVII